MSSRIKRSLLALTIFIVSGLSYADDLDILTSSKLVDANVLFVMDLSGSMNELSGSSSETRLQVLSGAFQTIIADDDFSEINIGLATFSGAGNSSQGKDVAHGIAYPISPIVGTPAQDILSKPGFVHPDTSYMPAAGTNDSRQYLGLLSTDSNIWSADGSTPIVDALYEASLYFRGAEVDYGKRVASNIKAAHPATYNGNLTLVTTTSTPSCTEASKVSCAKGSCGSTESCSINSVMVNSPTDTGGCTLATGNTTNCARGVTSCGVDPGDGSLCSSTTSTYTHFCWGSSDVTACQNAHPTWTGCVADTVDNTTTNSEGQTVTTSSSVVRCTEEVTWYNCEAADSYSCPENQESCTKCPDDVTDYSTSGTATYKSPIIKECAANAIILLTDGEPTENTSADKVASMIGGGYTNGCNTGTYDGRCGPELAEFMSTEDHGDGSTAVPTIDGLQNVKTYAVGLNLDVNIPSEADAIDFLNKVSMKGNGNPAIIAGSKAELVKAFKDAINDAVGKARSFSSPSYSVDKSTLLNNGEYVYIPVFDRGTGVWPGNLKKFKLVNGILTDANDLPALSPENALLPTAKDLWSTSDSTDVIKSGGAANKIDPLSRRSGVKTMKTNNIAGTSIMSLVDAANDAFGTGITTAEKANLVKYISGTNPADDTARNHMGDIIHSKPVQLQFAGASPNTGRKIIFVGTNEGFLHAINDSHVEGAASNGTEAFSFMPRELLKNIKPQYENTPSASHRYGVDGLITVWIDESANTNNPHQVGNGLVDVNNGEKAYVFFGLRRGGNSFTAINVTNPDQPILLWSKPFDNGNSWSQPVIANLKWKASQPKAKPVMVIGGGFTDNEYGEVNGKGNNVYIIDIETGNVVWDTSDAFGGSGLITNFSGSALPNAVPARIRVIDLDRDNSIDRLYFGDTGANIWRVDLNAAYYTSTSPTGDFVKNKATLHRIAALGGTGANDRKFFEEPDLAVFKNNGKLGASIAIGSGDRPSPLSLNIEDKFFVIYDKEILGATTANLVTVDDLNSVPVTKASAAAADYKGWQKPLTLSTGEKVLSSAITYKGKVLFTTFSVANITPDACNPDNTNENHAYVIDLFTGIQDAKFDHPGGEILATPKIIKPSGSTCVKGDCKQPDKIGIGKIIVDFPYSLDENGNPALDNQGNPISVSNDTLERVYWFDSEK